MHALQHKMLTLTVFILVFTQHNLCSAAPAIQSVRVTGGGWSATKIWIRVAWANETSQENICEATSSCNIFGCSKHGAALPNPHYCMSAGGVDTLSIPTGTTMQKARELWVKKYGVLSNELQADALGVSNLPCLSLVSTSGNHYGKWLPGMACVAAPPKDLTCTASAQLNIKYSTLDASRVNNAKSSENISITCTGNASVSLLLNGAREIDLGRSGALRATLDIQGKNLADGYSFKAGKNSTTLQVTSTLTSDV